MVDNRIHYTPNDIGPTPSDWKAVRLSDVSTLITNGFVGTASPFYSDETGIPYLYGSNIRANKIDLNDLRYVNKKFHQNQKKTSLQMGDLLTVQSGHIGETAVVPNCLENANCHALIVTRLKKSLASSVFVCQYFNSRIGETRLRGLEVGSTIAHINTKDLKKFRIPLPPLPEQKKIAAILSTWDRAIEETERLLANSQQQKKALMQQLLTAKKRLPGFVGDWELHFISDIANIRTAASKTPYICEDGERFIVDMGSVDRQGRLNCTKRTQHKSDILEKGTLIMPKDDIGGGNIIGKTALIDQDDLYVMGDHIYALYIKNFYSSFIHFLLNSYGINKSLLRKTNGTAQLSLGKKEVLKQEIRIPPTLPEQKTIAAVLTTADDEITAIKADLERLRQEKKALMQQLLTGKRRVVVDAEASA